VKLHRALINRYEVSEPILSAGGSMYFDRVAAILGPEGAPTSQQRPRVVLRSGAYIVHDDGLYRGETPSTRGAGPKLEPAMNVWARVISMPEPGLAYLDAGKRDLPYDAGLPEVQLSRRIGADGLTVSQPLVGHDLFETNDQHSFVHVPPGSPLLVGDVVRLGLSHPCTAFDKWSLIPVLDDASAAAPMVIDFVRTYF
jgi:D-serine deaminase-like pyridoxal phosphate-dependent protein